jgi:hemerythrin-like metal-binding protein
MKWSDEFATGDAHIDDQHKMLFQMAEDFQAALDDGMGEHVYSEFLGSLDLYARTHFGFEEGLMDRYQCPASLRNREAHARFVEVLSGFQQRYTLKGFDRGDALALVGTLERWLANHISRLDVQLRACVP